MALLQCTGRAKEKRISYFILTACSVQFSSASFLQNTNNSSIPLFYLYVIKYASLLNEFIYDTDLDPYTHTYLYDHTPDIVYNARPQILTI